MDNNCEDDLSMLYRLLRKVNTMDSCVRHFLDYIKVSVQMSRPQGKEVH